MVGFAAGLVAHHISFKNDTVRIICSVALGHIIGQVGIKSVGKILWYGMPWYGVFLGLGFSVLAGTLEVIVLRYLFKNKSIQNSLKGI
jgi:hypothetical protein